VKRLDLYELPVSHREGPALLNVLRFLDLPQALAMAAERSPAILYGDEVSGFDYAFQTAQVLSWPEKQLTVRTAAAK
jgi:hypothetical protein